MLAVSNVKDTVPKIGYNWLYIVFMLKSLRSYKAYSITTPKYISDEISGIFSNLRQRSIDKEREAIKIFQETGDDTDLRNIRDPKADRINLELRVLIVYIFKVIRILMIILLLAFVLGCFWYIYVSALWNEKAHVEEQFNDTAFFMSEYSLTNENHAFNMLKMTYFAFTTLSSVGFGDFYPQNTPERVFMIIIFLFTLTVFSAILGTMQDLLAA